METTNRKNLMILAFTLVVVMLGFGMVIPLVPFYKDYPIPYDDTMPWWMDWTWAFILDPIDEKTTRLIARLRSDGKGVRIMLAIHLLMEPSHFIMEHKMLLGIKQRAEALARQ